jgi:hypothetical protein
LAAFVGIFAGFEFVTAGAASEILGFLEFRHERAIVFAEITALFSVNNSLADFRFAGGRRNLFLGVFSCKFHFFWRLGSCWDPLAG